MSSTVPTQELSLPSRRGLTRAEYECAWKLGVFDPNERMELIEGEIIEKMTQNGPHATAVILVGDALRSVFSTGYVIRPQLPLALGQRSMPEPDVAVVTGSTRDHIQAHPTTAVLVVEISDSTLTLDRAAKAHIYARAGIPEYWIVNVSDRVLEVYRQPTAMAEQPLGHHYRSITRHTEEESIAPVAAPTTPIAVADLLP
ncbi:MAG TPA: Uma2 family endonuclease [Abditibacteriaceae bacterium]|nr:Uma2 family endonuclease [Abditibacteriaceae bacterium]